MNNLTEKQQKLNINMIHALAESLNKMKGFEVGYSGKTIADGYLYIEYEGKSFAVKITPMNEDSIKDLDISKKIDQTQYWV